MKTHEEMTREIRAKVTECYERARKVWPEKTFPMPRIVMDGVRGMTAGKAFYQQNEIRLNFKLLVLNYDAFLKTTVPHECAHLISFYAFGRVAWGHGDGWKRTMRVLGAVPTRCHSFDVSKVRQGGSFEYKCGCMTYAISSTKHNKIRKGARYTCRKCRGVLREAGKESPKFSVAPCINYKAKAVEPVEIYEETIKLRRVVYSIASLQTL